MTRRKIRIEELLPQCLEELGLPQSEREWIMEVGRPLTLRRGELFLRAGERARKVGILCHGSLTGYYLDGRGERRTTIFFVRPVLRIVLDFVGLYSEEPSEICIEAIKESHLWVIDREALRARRLVSPALGEWISGRLERFSFVLVRFLRSFQQPTSQERSDYLRQHFPELFEVIPRRYLATILGVVRG